MKIKDDQDPDYNNLIREELLKDQLNIIMQDQKIPNDVLNSFCNYFRANEIIMRHIDITEHDLLKEKKE